MNYAITVFIILLKVQLVSSYSNSSSDVLGIRKLDNFKANLVKGNFKFIYIFSDGTFVKRKGKLFYRKNKKLGPPSIVIPISNFKNIPESERRSSIGDDINQDLIWIQKSKRKQI